MQSEYIKQWLKDNGKTQQWLAETLGVTFATVNRWCNDKGIITASAEKLINLTFKSFDITKEYERLKKLEKEKSAEIKNIEQAFYDKTEELMASGMEMQEAMSKAEEQFPQASREAWMELNNLNAAVDVADKNMENASIARGRSIARIEQAKLDAVTISDDDLYVAAAAVRMHPQQLIQAILIKAAVKISQDISPE